MTSIPLNTTANLGARLDFGQAARFIAEPATKSGLSFSSILSGAGGVVARVAGAFLGGSTGGAVPGLEPQYQQLLQEQIYQQTQLQLMSFQSNVEKSKHEIAMTALRNIRVG